MARVKAEVDENIFETKKIVGGLVVALFVVAGPRTVVHGRSLEPRNPDAGDTCWVGLALMQCLLPSREGWVPVSNVVVQGSSGVQQKAGVVKQQQGGGSGMLAVVRYGGDSETARFGGFWGELGCWDSFWGCPDGSPGAFCRSSAVVDGAELGRAGGHMVVDDVAVRVGA